MKLYIDNSNLSSNALDPIATFEELKTTDIGSMYSLYETMLVKELHISGDLSKRIEDIVSLKYKLVGRNKKHIKFIQDVLNNLNFDDLIGELAKGIYYGYSLINLEWKNKIPINWKPIPLHLLQYDNLIDKNLYINDYIGNQIFIKDNDYKFLSYKESNTDLEKSGIARHLVYYVSLKHFFQNSFANAVNEWGLKKIILYTDECNNDRECLESKAYELNQLLSENGIAVIQKGLNDEGNSGNNIVTLDPQDISPTQLVSVNSYFDRKISNLVLGYTLGSDNNGNGSYALAQVQVEAKAPKINRDKINISQAVQVLINNIVKFNNLSPITFEYLDENVDTNQFLNILLKLQQVGYSVDEETIKNNLKIDVKKLYEQTRPDNTEHN
jgi:phage gp29-like protein